MKNKHTTVGKISKSNIKIIERENIYTPNKEIHDCSLSLLDMLINSGGVKLA
jgi:hypothetical protein